MAPILSVIVPVFNVEPYLGSCVNSILSQSFEDFELILVNDGSTDGSLLVCKEFELVDSRVKVVDKHNGGVSTARNAGLNKAQGEWICFVDSDDVIDSMYFSNLISNSNFVDLVLSGIKIIECETNETKSVVPLGVGQAELNSLDLLNTIPSLLLASPISKLFKRAIIECNQLKFDERISIGEDYIFVSSYLLFVDKVCMVNSSDYFYLRRKGSLSTSYNSTINELLSEQELYISTLKLYNKLGYSFEAIQKLYLQEFKKHAYRILFSLYSNKCGKYSRVERINIIKSVDREQKDRISSMFKKNGLNGFIISILFNRIEWFDSILSKLINIKLK